MTVEKLINFYSPHVDRVIKQGEDEKCIQNFPQNLNGRDCLGELSMDKLILNWILKNKRQGIAS
jgi:hypothetical protein